MQVRYIIPNITALCIGPLQYMFTVYQYLAGSVFLAPLNGDVLPKEYLAGLNFCK